MRELILCGNGGLLQYVGKKVERDGIRTVREVINSVSGIPHGEYRIGFVVPVVPLNCCGYVTYLNLIGKKEEYEKRFGRSFS